MVEARWGGAFEKPAFSTPVSTTLKPDYGRVGWQSNCLASYIFMLCLDQTIGDNRCSFLSNRSSWMVPRRRVRPHGAILPTVEPPAASISPLVRVAIVEALFSWSCLVPLLVSPLPSSSFSPQYAPLASSRWCLRRGSLSLAPLPSILFSLSEAAVGRKTAALVSWSTRGRLIKT